MQEVNNMNWYQSLWFKHFMGAAKDYSYFFFFFEEEEEEVGGDLFSYHLIVLNTIVVYSKSGNLKQEYAVFISGGRTRMAASMEACTNALRVLVPMLDSIIQMNIRPDESAYM